MEVSIVGKAAGGCHDGQWLICGGQEFPGKGNAFFIDIGGENAACFLVVQVGQIIR